VCPLRRKEPFLAASTGHCGAPREACRACVIDAHTPSYPTSPRRT